MTVTDDHLDTDTWWGTVKDALDTPVADLVDDFATIADQAIPYGWLPGRARSFYGAAFSTWSDLAQETITTLVERPKGGIGTVRAILIAARDAIAVAHAATRQHQDPAGATQALINRLADYDYQLLRARGWALRPTTIPATAEQLGVTRINVQRTQRRAYRRFTDLLSDPAHAAVTTHAEQLRRQLGSLTCESTAAAALADMGLDIHDTTGQLLLHVAGPYAPHHGWLHNTATGGLGAAQAALDAALDTHGAPTTEMLLHTLRGLGITTPTATAFIASQPNLTQFGDKLTRWEGTIADKAEAVLHLLGAPATPATIADLARTLNEDIRERAVRNALWDHPRFMRTTKRTWALRNWGLPEYTGLYSEIAARIDASGGTIATQDIVDDLKITIPDVSESSIRSYLSVPAFIVERGTVRHRTATDAWPQWAPLNTHHGTFHRGRHEVRIALPVTPDTLRGSGQPLRPGIGAALDVHPGEQRTFIGTHDITVFWSIASTGGANAGSLRTVATHLDAHLGDTLVLAFNLRRGTVTTTLIRADTNPATRLTVLLGKPARTPEDLARALHCTPAELPTLLTRRRELHLLDALDP